MYIADKIMRDPENANEDGRKYKNMSTIGMKQTKNIIYHKISLQILLNIIIIYVWL